MINLTLYVQAMKGAILESRAREGSPMNKSISEDFLVQFCKVAKVGLPEQIAIGLALAESEFEAVAFVLARIRDLPSSGAILTPEILHAVVSFLKTDERVHAEAEAHLNVLYNTHQKKERTVLGLRDAGNTSVDCLEQRPLIVSALVSEIVAQSEIHQCMRELGYNCTATVAVYSNFLTELGVGPGTLTPEQVAAILVLMTSTYQTLEPQDPPAVLLANLSEEPAAKIDTWNVDVVAQVLGPLTRHVPFDQVVKLLDRPGFIVQDVADFQYLVRLFKSISNAEFVIASVLVDWDNVEGQLAILRSALTSPPDLVSFTSTPNQLNGFDGADVSRVPANQCWLSLDLIACLVRLCETSVRRQAREVLDQPKSVCPDVLIAGLARLPRVAWNETRAELFVDLLKLYIQSRANAPAVLRFLWSADPKLVVHAIVHVLNTSATHNTLLRVFALLRNTGDALQAIVQSRYYMVAIALAVTGANHEVVSLENWLKERIHTQKLNFAYTCLLFVRNNYAKAIPQVNITTESSTGLSVESLAIFLKCLREISSNFPPPLAKEFEIVWTSCIKLHPVLGALEQQHVKESKKPAGNSSSSSGSLTQEQIEEKANSYFQRIYTSEQSLDEVIEMLKRFKNSKNETEKSIFVCMIHNLFDEYRFFHKYPDMELRITGVLFGNLIKHELVTQATLTLALRYVLDAVTKPSSSKLFRFGVYALDQFSSRFVEMPKYCEPLSKMKDLRAAQPELMVKIDQALIVNGLSPPESAVAAPAPPLAVSSPIASAEPPPKVNTPSRILSLGHIFGEIVIHSTLGSTDPDESLRDRLHFVINNVSISNLESKLNEMREFLTPQHFEWLSTYLVMKRISTQPNYHTVYLIMIEKLGYEELEEFVMKKALFNAKRLLESPTITTNSQERTLLKNLGSWLGLFTLARNRPLLTRDIDVKELLYVGYEHGHLIAVTSFIAKILDGCKKSKIFKAPNPWIMGLVRAMREIYDVPDLKLNIKFEIEVLCKALKLKLKDISKEDELKYRKTPPRQSNPDFNIKESSSAAKSPAAAAAGGKAKPSASPAKTPSSTPSKATTSATPTPSKAASTPGNSAAFQEATVIPNLAAYVSINSSLILFQQQAGLKRVIPVAVDRAIREIIQPVVERSVTIACITTRELIVKDFVNEGDDAKMRKAAHLMVSNLAGSLALVTCKEPLRVSIGNHIRSLLTSQSSSTIEQAQMDHVMQICSAENLELGCMLIEKAATEKAMRDIDESLGSAYTARRRHTEQSSQPFFDTAAFSNASRYPNALPTVFRPKPGGLEPQQLVVYDAFQRMQRQPVVPTTPTTTIRGDISEKVGKLLKQFEQIARDAVKNKPKDAGVVHLTNFPSDHSVFQGLRELKSSILTNDENCLQTARLIFQRLYELGEPGDELLLEILLLGLESILDKCPNIRKELVCWIIRASVEDKLKLHCDIILSLLRTKLIALNELDAYLARNIHHNLTALDFALHVIRPCLSMPHIVLSQAVPKTIESLERIIQHHGPSNSQVAGIVALIERINKQSAGASSPSTSGSFRHTISNVLERWISLASKSSAVNEKTILEYLSLLKQFGLLKDEETMALFLKIATELCIEACCKVSSGKPQLNYTVVDGFTKLITVLVKYADPNGNVKLNILKSTLTGIQSVLTTSPSSSFDQRAYFRLYAGLLHELTIQQDPMLEPIHFQILSTFANAFHTIQPLHVPGFVFSWMNLISHRTFLPILLHQKRGWPIFYRLLADMMLFLQPYLGTVQLSNGILKIYKGMVRVFLVLLHDFAEFLVEYHLNLCHLMPNTCVQLRNLILSAFPRKMRLPDPLTLGLQMYRIPECMETPELPPNWTMPLQPIESCLIQFLKTKQPVDFVQSSLMQHTSNVVMLNTITLYVGTYGIAQLDSSCDWTQSETMKQSSAVKLFETMVAETDSEKRYLILTSIVNQLRYPNAHTYYFSSLLLHLFASSSNEKVKEQITRVILERLIAHRPHPWGLLVTFIQLIRNKSYKFWENRFLDCSSEIKMVFDDVARSCLGPKEETSN